MITFFLPRLTKLEIHIHGGQVHISDIALSMYIILPLKGKSTIGDGQIRQDNFAQCLPPWAGLFESRLTLTQG